MSNFFYERKKTLNAKDLWSTDIIMLLKLRRVENKMKDYLFTQNIHFSTHTHIMSNSRNCPK